MLIEDSFTGGYLEGPPPPGSGVWAFLKWLFGPPKQVHPKRPQRTPEAIARLRRQIEEDTAARAAAPPSGCCCHCCCHRCPKGR
jgi:hypothetical protein